MHRDGAAAEAQLCHPHGSIQLPDGRVLASSCCSIRVLEGFPSAAARLKPAAKVPKQQLAAAGGASSCGGGGGGGGGVGGGDDDVGGVSSSRAGPSTVLGKRGRSEAEASGAPCNMCKRNSGGAGAAPENSSVVDAALQSPRSTRPPTPT